MPRRNRGQGDPVVTDPESGSREEDNRHERINIRPKEKEPDQPIHEYIKYFKRIAKINGWSDDISGDIFVAMLGPKDTSVHSFEGQWQTFTELEALLEKKQTPLRELNLAELMNLTKREAESVEALRDRTVHLINVVYPSLDVKQQLLLARDHFLYALPSGLRSQVITSRAESLDEVVNLAGSCSKLCQNDMEASIAATEPKPWKRFEKSGPKNKIICWKCGLPGHVQRFCRRNQGNSVNDVTQSSFQSPEEMCDTDSKNAKQLCSLGQTQL